MRNKRIRAFRKKRQGLFLVIKMTLICYLTVFAIGYISSDTSAYFSSQSKVSQTITTGNWEEADESGLVFTDNESRSLKTCPSVLKVTLKNKGSDPMLNPAKYEVYYSEDGDPKRGQKVQLDKDEGYIKALENGDTLDLTYQTNQPGKYIFKVLPSEENGKDNPIWSKAITVSCDEDIDKTDKDKDKDVEEKNKQNKKTNKDSKTETENPQKPETDKQKQPVDRDEPVNDTKEDKPSDQESVEEKAPEENPPKLKDAETNNPISDEKTPKKEESDINEQAKNNEMDK